MPLTLGNVVLRTVVASERPYASTVQLPTEGGAGMEHEAGISRGEVYPVAEACGQSAEQVRRCLAAHRRGAGRALRAAAATGLTRTGAGTPPWALREAQPPRLRAGPAGRDGTATGTSSAAPLHEHRRRARDARANVSAAGREPTGGYGAHPGTRSARHRRRPAYRSSHLAARTSRSRRARPARAGRGVAIEDWPASRQRLQCEGASQLVEMKAARRAARQLVTALDRHGRRLRRCFNRDRAAAELLPVRGRCARRGLVARPQVPSHTPVPRSPALFAVRRSREARLRSRFEVRHFYDTVAPTRGAATSTVSRTHSTSQWRRLGIEYVGPRKNSSRSTDSRRRVSVEDRKGTSRSGSPGMCRWLNLNTGSGCRARRHSDL